MHIGYVCRAVDPDDFNYATQTLWIRALAAEPRVQRVTVLARQVRPVDLPENVSVRSFANRKGRTGMVFRFLSAAAVSTTPDFYIVCQGGPYPALLLPQRLLLRRPVYQWKAHPHISTRMHFYVKYCDDLVFTATPSSFPLDSPKRRVVGHGIDTQTFRPSRKPPTRDLVVVGRISPIKRLERALHLIASASLAGYPWTLDVIGPPGPPAYQVYIANLARQLSVQDRLTFVGPMRHDAIASALPSYRACLNFSDGALDKTSAEAMACEVPVLTTNSAALEAIPEDLRSQLRLPDCDPRAQVDMVHNCLEAPESVRRTTGSRLRAAIIASHGLDTFFSKILDHIDEHRGRSRGDAQ